MKKVMVLLFLLFAGIIGVFAWWENGRNPVDLNDKSEKMFVVEKGSDVREIANKLNKEGFIRDPIVFFLYVKLKNLDKNVQAGDFRLSSSMALEEVVDNLLHGTVDIWITIPEGLRAEEIAQILKNNFRNYDNSWENQLSKHNGYLFPDTYLIPKESDIETIISTMKNNFYKQIKDIGLDENTNNLLRIVIIASLIEREVRNENEKVLVSSVIYNRLNSGIPLQIDATVQYSLSFQRDKNTWWKKDITIEDLNNDSLYNTYKVNGLPPGPISNPGISSLKAAAFPVQTDYYYYLSDIDGKTHFAKTLAEHNRNIIKYIKD